MKSLYKSKTHHFCMIIHEIQDQIFSEQTVEITEDPTADLKSRFENTLEKIMLQI